MTALMAATQASSTGYWRMIKAALPHLRKSPMPRIINIGSVHGKRPTCFDAGYAMTQGGVKMLSREAAIELQPDVVDPEDIEMLSDLLIAATNEAMRKAVQKQKKK